MESAYLNTTPETNLDVIDGVTGIVAERKFGSGKGPTVGVRVDMDALELTEAVTPSRRLRLPYRTCMGSLETEAGRRGSTSDKSTRRTPRMSSPNTYGCG